MDETSVDTQGPQLAELIARAVTGPPLSVEETEAAFVEVMEGRATSIQITALLVGLRANGEAPVNVAGGVRAMRRAMLPVAVPDGWTVVDTCGTGGGSLATFNISTAAALVAAGAGVRIAKHGNRSFTSRSGSADVLAALGVPIELTPAQMAEVFQRAGIVFMFAPLLHPAMKHVGPVRRELGMPTIMNVLGPLTNPAGARRQVVGVSHPRMLDLIAGALRELGHEHALVVHGEPGLDEFSPIGRSDIIEVRNGTLRRYSFDPATLDFRGHASDLAGGEPDDNADIIRKVLEGKTKGAARHAVTLNAGAAIYVAGLADSLERAVRDAEAAIDAGKGIDALNRLRESTLSVLDA